MWFHVNLEKTNRKREKMSRHRQNVNENDTLGNISGKLDLGENVARRATEIDQHFARTSHFALTSRTFAATSELHENEGKRIPNQGLHSNTAITTIN